MHSDALLTDISRLTEARVEAYKLFSAVYVTPPDGNFLKSLRNAASPHGPLDPLRAVFTYLMGILVSLLVS